MIGFRPNELQRRPVHNDAREKIGYIASVNGRQCFQDVNGNKIADILRFKWMPGSRTSACGGSFAPRDERFR